MDQYQPVIIFLFNDGEQGYCSYEFDGTSFDIPAEVTSHLNVKCIISYQEKDGDAAEGNIPTYTPVETLTTAPITCNIKDTIGTIINMSLLQKVNPANANAEVSYLSKCDIPLIEEEDNKFKINETIIGTAYDNLIRFFSHDLSFLSLSHQYICFKQTNRIIGLIKFDKFGHA